jgi:hypothetical protein
MGYYGGVGSNEGIIFAHQNCMWCWCVTPPEDSQISAQSELWYSTYGVPWSFNAATQVLLIGNEEPMSVPLPNNGRYTGSVTQGDQPMGAVSLGAQAMLFKRRSFYILDGVDSSTWFVYKRGDKTCISSASITVCGTIVCWLSDEGPIAYEQGQATLIGEELRLLLEGYASTDKANSVGFYQNRTWFLSFPATGVTWAYYFPLKVWRQLPYACLSVASIPSEYPIGGSNIGTTYALRSDSSYVDAWNYSETDLGNGVVATWNSPLVDSGKPTFRKTYHYVGVQAPVQPGVTAVVTVTVYDINGQSTTAVLDFNLGIGPFQALYIPNEPKGFMAQVSVTLANTNTATTPATIYSVTVGGTPGEAWAVRT